MTNGETECALPICFERYIMSDYKIETECVQGGYKPKSGEPRVLPIVQSTTYKYDSAADVGDLFDLKKEGFFYTRLANPTLDAVEKKIAALEGGVGAVLTSSGQAANLFAILNITCAGQNIVASPAIYGGTVNLFAVTLKKMGIEVRFCSPEMSEEEVDSLIDDNTRLIFGETIANPALKIFDIEKYAKIKEKNANEIRKFLPPQAEFQFYLDAEDGKILCKAKAVYGENDYDLMAWMNNDQKIDSFRDREMECNILSDVRKIFPEINEEKQSFDSGEDPDAVYQILKSGVADLMHLGEVQSTDRFRRLNIRKNVPVHVGVSIGSELMNLEIHSTELTQEELLDILNSYRKKQKYYRLRNGEFLDLQEDNLQELAEMLDDLHITPKEFVKGKMQLPLYRALYLDKMLEQCEGVYSDRDVRFKKLIKNFKTVEDSEYEVPEKLNQVLRKYQKYGYRWLRTLENCGFGGILADDMGLGKTLQVIAVLLAHKEENRQCHPALIVTPASLVYNWREEFAKYAPELSVGMITGNQTERQKSIEEYEKWDVLVTSYDLLKRDIAEYGGKIFSVQIIDEAQYIKNHTTAAAKSVKLISAHTKYALTGTPIENRLSELWSIFDYLMPGFLYTYDNFKKEMETPITKNQDADATALLKRMVSPFILRRLKGDVLKDLPEKLEENYYAVMEDEQQRLYDGQVIRMKQSLEKESEDNFRKNKLQILAELTRIRQICCDPVLLFDDYQGESAKRNTCLQLIENAIEGDHKVLLFSQFTSMLEILERDLKERQISYYKITGETSKEKRLESVQQFNADKVPVFLISLKAGGTGLNLTGADIVIHYDPWWNVAAQNQATDRAHRIGQTKTVSVYKLIVKNSIEEKILKMQEDKKNLADAVLNGESTNLMDMTKDDLLQLLG